MSTDGSISNSHQVSLNQGGIRLSQHIYNNHPEIDFTIVCGSRPDLLARTLESFSQKLFPNFRFSASFANIDLFGGNEEDRDKCEALLLSYFPEIKISKPTTPSFGKAVKSLWLQTTSPFIFHLEDDWIALECVQPEMVFRHFSSDVKVVTLTSKEHKLDKHIKRYGDYYLRAIDRKKLFGLTLWSSSHNDHGVSPGFFDGKFARKWASMIDPNLDPEKQVKKSINKPLFDFVTQYKRRMLTGVNQLELIQDIGREWHAKVGIKKSVINGKSIWTDY